VIASLIASTIAFFVASYFIKSWMDQNDIPKGVTRSLTIFALAIAVSYGVGWLVGLVA
jgi:VIT1/CCC1 family predicted Fe2+/Mn2+ transporter